MASNGSESLLLLSRPLCLKPAQGIFLFDTPSSELFCLFLFRGDCVFRCFFSERDNGNRRRKTCCFEARLVGETILRCIATAAPRTDTDTQSDKLSRLTHTRTRPTPPAIRSCSRTNTRTDVLRFFAECGVTRDYYAQQVALYLQTEAVCLEDIQVCGTQHPTITITTSNNNKQQQQQQQFQTKTTITVGKRMKITQVNQRNGTQQRKLPLLLQQQRSQRANEQQLTSFCFLLSGVPCE